MRMGRYVIEEQKENSMMETMKRRDNRGEGRKGRDVRR